MERVDVDAVALVYTLTPLTEDLVRRLNGRLSLADPAEDIAEIGYPG